MVLVGRIVALDIDDGVVGAETSEGVDVRIGVVARQIAVVEPKDAFGAEAFAEQQFDLSAIGHRHRVAFETTVGIEEASGRGEERAGAVALDGTAFEFEIEG